MSKIVWFFVIFLKLYVDTALSTRRFSYVQIDANNHIVTFDESSSKTTSIRCSNKNQRITINQAFWHAKTEKDRKSYPSCQKPEYLLRQGWQDQTVIIQQKCSNQSMVSDQCDISYKYVNWEKNWTANLKSQDLLLQKLWIYFLYWPPFWVTPFQKKTQKNKLYLRFRLISHFFADCFWRRKWFHEFFWTFFAYFRAMYMGQATAQILKLNDFPFYRSSSSQVVPIKGSWHICYSCRKLNYGHSKSNLTLAIDFSKTLLRNLLQPPWSSSESKEIIHSFRRADVSEYNR